MLTVTVPVVVTASGVAAADGMDVSRVVTITGFVVICAAIVALHLYGKRPDTRVPSFADLCGFIMRDRWGRRGVLFAWLWLGWHFLARS